MKLDPHLRVDRGTIPTAWVAFTKQKEQVKETDGKTGCFLAVLHTTLGFHTASGNVSVFFFLGGDTNTVNREGK